MKSIFCTIIDYSFFLVSDISAPSCVALSASPMVRAYQDTIESMQFKAYTGIGQLRKKSTSNFLQKDEHFFSLTIKFQWKIIYRCHIPVLCLRWFLESVYQQHNIGINALAAILLMSYNLFLKGLNCESFNYSMTVELQTWLDGSCAAILL